MIASSNFSESYFHALEKLQKYFRFPQFLQLNKQQTSEFLL